MYLLHISKIIIVVVVDVVVVVVAVVVAVVVVALVCVVVVLTLTHRYNTMQSVVTGPIPITLGVEEYHRIK